MEDISGKELVPSDSDEDIDFTARKKHGKQALRIAETDSEEEENLPLADPVETVESRGGSNTEVDSNESKESSDDGENIASSTQRKKKKRKKKSDKQDVNDEHKSKIDALCDEDSSSDESDRHVETVETKKERAPQRMSAKQAEEQMKVIQSESQRLARECPLSVPYHKPKQHTLKDFLSRRTINRPVPMALTKKAAATIKMSKEELEQYAKSLEDRNKESQEFYRSDSDDSIDGDKENTSKCDEQQNIQQEETDALMESTEAVNLIEDSVEPTSNDATKVSDIAEKSNEATMTAVESPEAITIVEDTVKTANIDADVDNIETEILDKISTDASSENVTASAMNENESDKEDTAIKAKETIEIDYDFGEDEPSEIKTLKELLPAYSNAKPCLKGPVNGIINLDDDEKPIKSGGDKLLERFIKHVGKRPNTTAQPFSILSTDNGIVELNNIQIETDQNCIHSKPRKDVYKLKEELSLRIAAKRKEELKKKQITAIEIPMEESSDSDCDMKSSKEIESSADVNGGSNKENYESDVEENGNISENGDGMAINGDDETIDGNEESNDENHSDDEEDDVDEVDAERTDGCELVQKAKQRKRIILLDNSDDDDDDEASSDGKLENSTVETNSTADLNLTVDLNTTSMSLDDNNYVPDYPIDKTMSQICENQNRADEMIDGCSKIVPECPEQDETDNNMSTLFSQTADNISVSELLDLCSGSFVTQPASANCVGSQIETGFEGQANNFSDNEFSDDEIGQPKKSKQRKKVNISDDEDQDNEDANIIQNDESKTSNNDGNESDADDGNLSEDEEEERIVEYDSEENEIEVPVVQKKKIADFFEDEAELSESEWGSADEDEQNLDKFDIELGDEDEFDQNQLVSELDRIHRRRMLDQDAREVKIIKDTHFEDEEESGVGRQRQFKWKHMENSLNIDENQKTDDVDANENAKSDDENEETWRRMRHERNNVLQETKNQNEINESKLIVTTKTKKRISIVKTAANLNTSATKDLSFLISKMKEEQTHRSSLLIRDEATLANLAKLTTDDSIPSVNSNSKNFLFNVISSEDGKAVTKRKLDDDGTDGDSKKRIITKKFKKSTLSVLDKLL